MWRTAAHAPPPPDDPRRQKPWRTFRRNRRCRCISFEDARPDLPGWGTSPCLPTRPRGLACSGTLVGLLTPRLGRLHAFSRASRLHRTIAMARTQPASSPGYSGGAVPESHRSSLFARRKQLRSTGHQIRAAQSIGGWVPVKQRRFGSPDRQTFTRRSAARETVPVGKRKRLKM